MNRNLVIAHLELNAIFAKVVTDSTGRSWLIFWADARVRQCSPRP
jgi:hypothetical protein